MTTLGPSPFAWLEFDATGALAGDGAAPLAAIVADPAITDLVVMSHGWKNDRTDATALYGGLWQHARAALKRLNPVSIAVAGVLWPAKAYQTDFDDAAMATSADGTTLGTGKAAPVRDLTEAELQAALGEFASLFPGADVAALAQAAGRAQAGLNDASARAVFRAATAIARPDTGSADPELAAAADPFVNVDSAQAKLASLSDPPLARPVEGGTQGLADVVGGLISGPRAAIARFLNQLTYYEMKQRAGVVGDALGRTVLPGLKPRAGLRLHLVGHSFGGRLVSAAAAALPATSSFRFQSLTLLQAAFSQNGFAAGGAFERFAARPVGPISITHTHNDRACTFWYPLASRLSDDIAKALGDATDPYGAMGANGPQHMPQAMLAAECTDTNFAPRPGLLNRFLADSYVVATDTTDAHNNVATAATGKLLAATMEA